MKKTFIRIMCLCFAMVMVSLCAVSCTDEGTKAAIKYVDKDGKTTAVIDQSFLSFWIAVQNNQYKAYISAFDEAEGWQTILDKQNGKTLNDVMLEEAVRTASAMLEAEYIHDFVYNISFSDEQQDSVDLYIDALIEAVGDKKSLESLLSTYGASIESLKRYLILSAKYQTLFQTLYSEGADRAITEQMKKEYFVNNYVIADHILFDTRGKQKDDGTVVPLTDEEKDLKKASAEELFTAITSGVYTFDEAKELYSEDKYSSEYPFGYFVTNDGTFWEEFQNAALEMQQDELRLVETNAGYHIILKKPMKDELYMSNGNFNDSLGVILAQEDFVALLETAQNGIVVNDSIVSELNPSLIKPFAFDEAGSK